MELSHDEEKVLAAFRRLSPQAKAEAIDYLAFLAKKHEPAPEEQPEGQCRLGKTEQRPEKAKEPIFTE